ncbi:MAG: hypothetical protein ACKV2T_10930 [Kofleriaceae bacterium]
MIPIPQGWGLIEQGRAFLLVHPSGPQAAALRYCERMGEPRRIGALVRELVAALPGVTHHAIGDVERFTTDEGELAAAVSIDATDAAGALRVDVAYVFTDDFYSSLVGISRGRSSEIRAIVRDLARLDNHALGIRRRRFPYVPPRNWQPIARGLTACWIPPDVAHTGARLLVYPANPISVVGRASFGETHLHLEATGWAVIDVTAPREGTTRRGLRCEVQRIVCRRGDLTRLHRIAIADDSQYQYPLELWTRAGSDLQSVLDDVLDSITPLAAPVTKSAALEHWVD